MMSKRIVIFILLMAPLFHFCSTEKNALEVVDEVNLQKYTGTWYEIARLPNRFEKGLKCVTATYQLREDGKITVINKGHKVENPQKAEKVEGWAKVPNPEEPGKLKVTFFWPFFGKYWIIDLDADYQYALVGSPSRKYLWVLARDKKLKEDTYKKLLKTAKEKGFDTSNLIRTEQDCAGME
jgi:lipocalin